MDAKQILDSQFDQLVETLKKVVSYNTERSAATANAPFGTEVTNCLHYVLDLAKSVGLETYNCDNYAGHADFVGTGKKVLGILGHLDVVPAKPEEWSHPPFAGEIADGKLFGRGTMDDKGPMIACLFAVKALKESGYVPQKTVRLIFGCDEETSMRCVEHYFTKMPHPDVSFSPDADFPVINREKGIYQFDIVCGKLPKGVAICAGERSNVVPSKCVVKLPTKDVAGVALGKISAERHGSETTLTSVGKAAHASTPNEGINATHPMLKILHEIYPENDTIAFLAEKLCDTTGQAWGVRLHDQESGDLTCNIGVLQTAADGTLTATVDIRFPVSYNCTYMYGLLRKTTPEKFDIVPQHISDPLFVPSDSKLVTTLMDVYNSTLKCDMQPIAIGGGTYSRCLPNCVAFGPLFPGEPQTIHMPDECISLDNLKTMTELYMQAIYRLSCDQD